MYPEHGAKPFLRWAGSKRRLLPRLIPFWKNTYHRYVEPFMGSASLFFAVRPPMALLSDINADLVDTFVTVRDHPLAVHKALQQLPKGEDGYYEVRRLVPEWLSSVKRAARFIFLNRFCFNGLYRTNAKGCFNVPFSPARTGPLPTGRDLHAASVLLRNAEIVQADFQYALRGIGPGDFVYLDPPYAVSNRRVFRQYGPKTFGTEDLSRLAATLQDLDCRGVSFVVTYAFCVEAIQAFRPWNTQKVFTQRNVAGFSRYRRRAAEIIAWNCRTLS